MASRTSLTEQELIQHIAGWQSRLAGVTQTVGQLYANNLARLRQGGVAGNTVTGSTLNLINEDILIKSIVVQSEIHLLLHEMLTLFKVTASGAISSGAPITYDNLTMDTDLATFFGVADPGDTPYAWWIHDAGATDGKYLLATEVDPDTDMVAALQIDPGDVILVQDSNAATDDDGPAGIQKGRRLVVALTDDGLTHDGTTYYGEIQFDTDTGNPYSIRDIGALAASADEKVKDTRLILRRVFDETV
jgi:hypothetical protein